MKQKHDTLIEQLINCPVTIGKNGAKIYWFDQPYHLYLEDKQANLYLDMINAEKFSSQLHEPTERLIEKYTTDILKDFKGKLEFYDLGPGLPTKSIPLLKELQLSHREFKYIPVDISTSFIKIATEEVAKIGVKSDPINCLFEDLNKHIDLKSSIDRLFFIGLTFNNYRPNKILSLLKDLCEPNGVCLIITEYFTKDKIESILVPYKDKYAENFNYLALELTGINRQSLKYFTNFHNQRIEMGFSLIEDIKVGDNVLKKGTKIITAISYRYTRASLTNNIRKYFKHFTYYELENKTTLSLVAFKLYHK